MGIIIGKETGKILFMGVGNKKYCPACNKAGNDTPPEHTCWKGSSSSMETDIILKGFKQCEKQHGVRYIEFIGDRYTPHLFQTFMGLCY